jgi:membrane protein YqaA with SNARE-associated domain
MVHEFTKESMFSYNLKRKRISSVAMIAGIILVMLFIVYYAFFLRSSDNLLVNAINLISGHIWSQVTGLTLLGALYITLIGGLFFVFMPIEAWFIAFIGSHNPLLIVALFILGFLVSYSINYYIGRKLNKTSKAMIGPRKFYKIKALINKRGGLAIFAFNALPLPSQPLSAILGVFRYNKTRFYLYFLLGQLTKYIVISVAYIYII